MSWDGFPMYLHCIRSLHFFQGSTNLLFHTQILSTSVTCLWMISLLIFIVYICYTFFRKLCWVFLAHLDFGYMCYTLVYSHCRQRTVEIICPHSSTPLQCNEMRPVGNLLSFCALSTRSTKKVMSTIFWDSKGVIHIDYLPHGTTMNGKYYANLLKQVRQSIKEKRRGKIRRGIMLHQDNAPVHTSRVAMDAVRECGYELLPHPPYSPDLAPSDFHLFPRLKKHLRGRRFDDDGELTAAVEGWLGDQDVDFYRSGINDWKTRWDKCVELEGDYVEK